MVRNIAPGDPSEHQDFLRAHSYLTRGYFDGVRQQSRLLRKLGPYFAATAEHLDFLADLYDSSRTNKIRLYERASKRQTIHLQSNLPGTQGLAHLAYFYRARPHDKLFATAVDALLRGLDFQRGCHIDFHPTAILGIAGVLMREERSADASRLVCSALGSNAWWNIEDVQSLAELLRDLGAPVSIWSEWAWAYARHLRLARLRCEIFAQQGDLAAARWAIQKEEETQTLLGQVLEFGPPILRKVLGPMLKYMGWSGFEAVLDEHFPASKKAWVPCAPKGDSPAMWLADTALQGRYFWFDMIADHEKDFIRNGEWAFANNPTQDYSMALAQWWRAAESVLKRMVVLPIAELFKQNPAWRDFDRNNLSPAKQKNEAIFIDKLSERGKAEKVTLGDIVTILQKCTGTGAKKSGGSMLRQQATKLLEQRSRQVEYMFAGDAAEDGPLSTDIVAHFRNRPSHDSPVDFASALTGRYLARRLLDRAYRAALIQWGFQPQVIILRDGVASGPA